MKVLCFGSRDFSLLSPVIERMDKLYGEHGVDAMVIHGDASGADTICAVCAEIMGMKVKAYPANWRYGKHEGHLRNQQMLNENPDIDLGIGFRTRLASPGTNDMIKRLEKASIPYEIYDAWSDNWWYSTNYPKGGDLNWIR